MLTAAVVGGFTWPGLAELPAVAYTMIRVAWYSSLILSIGSVAVGVQQSVFLMRLHCVPKYHVILRDILGVRDETQKYLPRDHQIILWQLAVGLLEVSIYSWLGGFVVFVCASTRTFQKDQSVSDQLVGWAWDEFAS